MLRTRKCLGVHLTAVLLVALAVLLVSNVATAQQIRFFNDKSPWLDRLERMNDLAEEQLGIRVDMNIFSDTSSYQAAVRTTLRTPSTPDVFTWWTKYRMEELVQAGALLPLDDLWARLERTYDPSLASAFSLNGHVYAIPLHVSYWSVWYNVDVFERLGLSEPKTWDELMHICETLHANGIIPFGLGNATQWPAFIWFEELLIRTDPDFYEDLMEGRAHYTDPQVTRVFLLWKEMLEKGWFTNPEINDNVDLPRMFGNGEVGMILWGDWYTANIDNIVQNMNYSTFIMPPVDESVGNVVILEAAPIVISARTRNPEAAVAFLEWWMSDDAQTLWTELSGFISPNPNVPLEVLPEAKRKLAADIRKGQYRTITRFWEATPPAIAENAVHALARFILNPNDYERVQRDLEQIASDYWKSRQ